MEPLKMLLFALADDELLMGHRASEWTGLGPILEADLALSSIAQDEMGHALLFYDLLGALGETEPDSLAFGRSPAEFYNAILCELPRGDWGETLMRHFLYDLAEQVRLEALAASSYAPLAAVATKLRSEEKYHMLHGSTWLKRLGQGTEESHRRLQSSLDQLLPYAVGLWETIPGEAALVAQGIMPPSNTLRDQWYATLTSVLTSTFALPALSDIAPVEGGRRGEHSEHLVSLLDAMQLLHREFPGAKW
ncbi:MAG: phenylacetate-CoA oxygenase subunit PaaC [Ardenticatenales bacterium]|nr:phenylacetate-CoA oxygenase subunit PaaC [Ardenticatenales bacterium]